MKSLQSVSRRNLIGLLILDVVLFAIAELTYKSTVSNVAWGAFLIGTAVLIALAVASLVLSRRPAR